ncbi:MAG: SgcJ/EcaC family oxidoreductase, partial [Gammaproteobacteria bacterium]|nr:SgcJ/EcaC family oxidoreductase [Gammaproteobacteria bacterium]
MGISVRSIFGLAVALVVVLPVGAFAQNPDVLQIRDVVKAQAVDWNRHDAKAYAALFTENCDVVNVVGWWWKGRTELQNRLTAAFSHAFRESMLTISDVQVRFLTPEIALAHAYWTMTGAKMPPGMPEPR